MAKPDEVRQKLEEKAKEMPPELAKFVRNPKLAEVFAELSENENARDEAKGDPAGWLRRKGVNLPEDARAEVRDDEPTGPPE